MQGRRYPIRYRQISLSAPDPNAQLNVAERSGKFRQGDLWPLEASCSPHKQQHRAARQLNSRVSSQTTHFHRIISNIRACRLTASRQSHRSSAYIRATHLQSQCNAQPTGNHRPCTTPCRSTFRPSRSSDPPLRLSLRNNNTRAMTVARTNNSPWGEDQAVAPGPRTTSSDSTATS
jgi:hypothetical protein